MALAQRWHALARVGMALARVGTRWCGVGTALARVGMGLAQRWHSVGTALAWRWHSVGTALAQQRDAPVSGALLGVRGALQALRGVLLALLVLRGVLLVLRGVLLVLRGATDGASPGARRSYLDNGYFVHNHPLPQTTAASLAFQYSHKIPDDLHEWASSLQGFRLPSDLHAMMCKIVRERGQEPTWTQKDIANRYGAQGGVGAWDVDGFVRKIMKTSSTWDYLNSESGVLDNAYWGVNEDDASVDVSSQSVVIFDNTFNTNRYGYKLGFFSVVDRQGRIILYKGKPAGKGGWALAHLTHLRGNVTEHNEQLFTVTFGVQFCVDGSVSTVTILPHKQTKQGEHGCVDVGAWWPLTEVTD